MPFIPQRVVVASASTRDRSRQDFIHTGTREADATGFDGKV